MATDSELKQVMDELERTDTGSELKRMGEAVEKARSPKFTYFDFGTLIKETLESRGTLGQIKARLRAEVFNVIDDKTEQKPILTNENLLINELIREYLEFNQYKYTCSVLLAESDQPDLSLDRKFIEDQLNVSTDPDAKDIPLLYSIMAKLKKPNTKRSIHPFTKDDQSHGDALIFRGSKP